MILKYKIVYPDNCLSTTSNLYDPSMNNCSPDRVVRCLSTEQWVDPLKWSYIDDTREADLNPDSTQAGTVVPGIDPGYSSSSPDPK